MCAARQTDRRRFVRKPVMGCALLHGAAGDALEMGPGGRRPKTALFDLHDRRVGACELEPTPLILIGEQALCKRYADTLCYLGQPVAAVLGNTAAPGLWNFAVATGVLPPVT